MRDGQGRGRAGEGSVVTTTLMASGSRTGGKVGQVWVMRMHDGGGARGQGAHSLRRLRHGLQGRSRK